MKISFTKMHGLGNDFVLIDTRDMHGIDWKGIAGFLLNRRLGIGGDQLLLLDRSLRADFRMGIFNPDGSEVEMWEMVSGVSQITYGKMAFQINLPLR